MRVTTTRGLAVAVGLLVAALLGDAGATLYNIRDVATSVEWVSHTHEVLAKLVASRGYGGAGPGSLQEERPARWQSSYSFLRSTHAW